MAQTPADSLWPLVSSSCGWVVASIHIPPFPGVKKLATPSTTPALCTCHPCVDMQVEHDELTTRVLRHIKQEAGRAAAGSSQQQTLLPVQQQQQQRHLDAFGVAGVKLETSRCSEQHKHCWTAPSRFETDPHACQASEIRWHHLFKYECDLLQFGTIPPTKSWAAAAPALGHCMCLSCCRQLLAKQSGTTSSQALGGLQCLVA